MATLTYPMARRTGHSARAAEPSRDFGAEYRRVIGNYIADKRIARGMTQLQLAKHLGMRDTAVSAIELGRNSLSPERVEDVANALELNKRAFGKFVLRYTNPWLFSLIFPNELSREAIGQLPERISDDRDHAGDTDSAD